MSFVFTLLARECLPKRMFRRNRNTAGDVLPQSVVPKGPVPSERIAHCFWTVHSRDKTASPSARFR